MKVLNKEGLQMAIIFPIVYWAGTLCVLAALVIGIYFYRHTTADAALNYTCLQAGRDMKKYARVDSSKVLLIGRNLKKKFPVADFAETIIYLGYSDTYKYWGDDSLSVWYTKKALELAQTKQFYPEEAVAYLQLFEGTQNEELSLEYLQKVETIRNFKNLTDPDILYRLYYDFGFFYFLTKDYGMSKKYFIKLIDICRANKMHYEESVGLLGLSMAFANEGKNKIALHLTNKSLVLCLKYCPIESGDMYFQQGIILNDMKHFSVAKTSLLKAKEKYSSHPHPYNSGQIDGVLGSIYLNQGQYDKAHTNLEKFLVQAKYYSTKSWALNLLFRYYLEQKDYKKALLYKEKTIQLMDSVHSESVSRSLGEKKANYKIFQQKLEYNKIQLQYKFFLIVVIVILIGFIVNGISVRRNYIMKNQLIKLEQEKLQQTVEFKQRQLATNTLQLSQHSDLIKRLSKDLEQLNNLIDVPNEHQVKAIIKSISKNLISENNWENSKLHFESVSPYFFDKLKEKSSALSELDLKHCVYLKMNLTPKQVAQILSVNPKSVTLSRVRIKKKLQLDEDENLSHYLASL